MKIMTYNVYRGGEDRFALIAQIIQKEQPDILAIQEACDWDISGRAKKLQQALGISTDGMKYFQANQRSASGRRYDMVLYSRYPILSSEFFHESQNIWHGIPHVVVAATQPLHIFPVHFSPQKEWRPQEAQKVNELLQQHKDEPMLLLGDLNDLSPHDNYKADLFQQLQEYKIDKFGLPPDFSVIKQLEAAGWHDALLQQPDYDGKLHISVTESSDDKDHHNLRLDYVMVNQVLLPKVCSVSVLGSEENTKASDHFPVVADLK